MHKPQIRVHKKKIEQTNLCLGMYAMPRLHPDRFALELLHVILGANMSSRLFREVREKRGLVYDIGSHIKRFQDTGAFVIAAGCDTVKLDATLRTTFAELARAREGTISEAELKRAKEYFTGQLIMGLEDTLEHMLWLGEQAITIGRLTQPEKLLPHIDRVQAEDVQRVTQRLFQTNRMHLAVVGNISQQKVEQLFASHSGEMA